MAITRAGVEASARLIPALGPVTRFVPSRWIRGDDGTPFDGPARAVVAQAFGAYDGLILFMALGAAVRLLAPLLRDKRTDPAVVVVDETAQFAISVLSGHAGGANALTQAVASALGATSVITTASDRRGLPALDLLGRHAGWRLNATREALTRASAALINGEPLVICQDAGDETWQGAIPAEQRRRCGDLGTVTALAVGAGAAVLVTDRHLGDLPDRLPCPCLVYYPPTIVAGVGCSRGAPAAEIDALLHNALEEAGVAVQALSAFATIDLKRDEPGITDVAERHGVPVRYFAATQLAATPVPNPSPLVAAAVGTPSVCEAAALLAAEAPELLLPKRKTARATVALARRRTSP